MTGIVRASPVSDRVDSPLRNLLITEPGECPASFALVSGRVDFLHVVGVTDTELMHAGAEGLLALLQEQGVYPLTDPHRDCQLEA